MKTGIMMRCKGTPADFNAVSSRNSPRLPNVIRAASSMASGRERGTKVRENWKSSSASTFGSRPLPASSSTYIKRNWRIKIMRTIKNVRINGPMNDLIMNRSIFFIVSGVVQTYDIFEKDTMLRHSVSPSTCFRYDICVFHSSLASGISSSSA